jgi:hypothetical protein
MGSDYMNLVGEVWQKHLTMVIMPICQEKDMSYGIVVAHQVFTNSEYGERG